MNSPLAIDLRAVTKTYDNGGLKVPVLHGIDLQIEHGEYVAIMGPSGSGKSTLMNIVGCLDRATTGTYVLDGENVEQLSDNDLAGLRLRKLGFIFQGFNLLARTDAVKNVSLPLFYAGVSSSDRKARAQEALAQVGLADRAHHKPNQLSGGQQQRVAIARALINNPAVLLADEPTGNLDTRTSADIMALFETLYTQGRTIVMVTHDDDVARHAKRIIRLRDGLVVADERN